MARTLAPWLAELHQVLPESGSRPAEDADAVDGTQPAFVVEPATVAEAAAVLRFASNRGLAVAPVGGRSKLSWGDPPDRIDLVLSTRRLDRVIEHAPGDLVVRAEAGVPLAALQALVGASGQFLALDPPHEGATLGGVVATGASGPRRLRYGTPRDLLIGITYVLADGTVAHAGGRVVKNVAGYDLMKLFAGSFGTLGLIAEVTFRLHPRPAAWRWVGVRVSAPEQAGSAVRAVLDDRGVEPSAVELRWRDRTGRIDVLFEGTAAGVDAQVARARVDLDRAGPFEVADGPDATDAPGAPPAAAGHVLVKVTHPPASLPGVLHELREVQDRHGLPVAASGHAATGVTFVAAPWSQDASDDGLRRSIEDLRGWAFASGGSAVVQHAPPSLKRELDAWGPAGDAVPLMRRVKERFDPKRVLNPGRFVGGI